MRALCKDYLIRSGPFPQCRDAHTLAEAGAVRRLRLERVNEKSLAALSGCPGARGARRKNGPQPPTHGAAKSDHGPA